MSTISAEQRQAMLSEALKEASNREATLWDVINAIKAISMDMRQVVKVLDATIDFLTNQQHQNEANNQDAV